MLSKTLENAKKIEKENKTIVVTACNANKLSLRHNSQQNKYFDYLMSSKQIASRIKKMHISSDIFHVQSNIVQPPIYALTIAL